MSNHFVERMGWEDRHTFTVRRQVRLTHGVRHGEKAARHMSKSGFHLSHVWPVRWGGSEVRGGIMHAHGNVLNQGRIARFEGFIERLSNKVSPHGHKVWVSVVVERYPEANLLKNAHYQFEVEFGGGGGQIVGTVDIPQDIPEAQRRLLAEGKVVQVDTTRFGSPQVSLMNDEDLDEIVELGRTQGKARPRGGTAKSASAKKALHTPEAKAAKPAKRGKAEKGLPANRAPKSRPTGPKAPSRAADAITNRATGPEARGTMPESSATDAPTAAESPSRRPHEPPPRSAGHAKVAELANPHGPHAPGAPVTPDLPQPSTHTPRLRPTARSVAGSALRKARDLLLPTGVWDIATFLLDQVLSHFEDQLSRVNQEQIERSFKSAVRPVEQEINRIWSMLEQDPTLVTLRKPVYYCFRWQVVMEIQADDASDVGVFLARTALLRPGFAEVYSGLNVTVPAEPLLRSAPWPEQEPERRKRPGDSNFVDYFRVSCILIRHPKVTALLDAMTAAREGASQRRVDATQAIAALGRQSSSLEWSLLGVEMQIRNDDYQSAETAAREVLQQLFDTTDDSGWAARQAVFDLANWCEEWAGTLTRHYRALNESQRILARMRAPHYPPQPLRPSVFEELLRQQPVR